MMIWVPDDLAQNWSSPRRKTRGGQPCYSDLAIEITLTMRVVFRLAMRQGQAWTLNKRIRSTCKSSPDKSA
ncbi:MAG: transposase [Pseudomonadota bacterium]